MLGTMTTATGQTPKAALSNHSLLQRATRSDMRRILAQRLLAARDLNGYSQTDAALKFGYKTPAQLSQWEMGRRMVPLEKLVRASAIYRVSLDYLMGVSPEPDRDPQAAHALRMLDGTREMLEAATRQLAEEIIEQTKLGGPTIEVSMCIVDEADRLTAAWHKFMELNGTKFENMRAGNPLKIAMESFEANGLNVAREQIERYKRIGSKATKAALNKLRAPDARTRHLFETSDA
jgi:transcriptional regulator with XRE-family HTH domain